VFELSVATCTFMDTYDLYANTPSIREWARRNLAEPPPAFYSKARRTLHSQLLQQEQQLASLVDRNKPRLRIALSTLQLHLILAPFRLLPHEIFLLIAASFISSFLVTLDPSWVSYPFLPDGEGLYFLLLSFGLPSASRDMRGLESRCSDSG
jgi:hypothetical protein